MTTAQSNRQIFPDTWKNNFLAALPEQNIVFDCNHDYFIVVSFPEYNLSINLINIENRFFPAELIALQNFELHKGVKLINLWEDVWLSKAKQVIFRVKSLLGLNKTIHGRKTNCLRLDKAIADKFLNENHLQGAVSSRYKYGLYYLDELVAVATFSALREMNHSANYKSIELIRFAVSGGFSITGGLSKLINHAKNVHNPADIMTYADCDWSSGDAYLKLGFQKVAVLEPQHFVLDDKLNRILIKEGSEIDGLQVFNTGSLKFTLKF